jgi:hypothetical protein
MQSNPDIPQTVRICHRTEMEVIGDDYLIAKLTAMGERHDALIAEGVPALRRLVNMAETRNSGQIRKIALVLAGLYNSYSYPLPMIELRGLDANIVADIFAVMRMDAEACEQEVHTYFEDGGPRFKAIFRDFGIEPPSRNA